MQYLSTSPHLKPKIPHHFSMSSAENRFLSQCMAGPQKPMNAFRLAGQILQFYREGVMNLETWKIETRRATRVLPIGRS